MSGNAFNLTPEQLEAASLRGGSLLVSAAAGSGKTRVLVERLMRYLTDEECPRDVTDFLVITYTKAAAAELKAKITSEIAERIAASPKDARLRRQAALCHAARIDTIHGFCTQLLRDNAHLLEIAPDFRVADDSESAILKAHVLDDLLDRRYEESDGDPGFSMLADMLSSGWDDSRLAEAVLDAHSRLQCHFDPPSWMRAQLEALENAPAGDVSATPWGRYLMDDALRKAAYWRGVLERLLSDAAAFPAFEGAYGASVAASIESIARFESALRSSWDASREASSIDFPRPKSIKGFEKFKEVRSRCREALKKVSTVFECSSAELLEDMLAVLPAVRSFLKLVLDFDEAYAREKKKRGLIDFSDQEHLALRLLVDPSTGLPTDLARAVSERFVEILVDEYQDCSAIQEAIFNAISRGGRNVFMVGDVRQSIYRFRLADPSIFLRKYKSFSVGPESGEGGRLILLPRNFRSRPGILGAVNFVFKNVMSEQFGEMDYTEREHLVPGRTGAEAEGAAVELFVLDMRMPDADDDLEDEPPEKIRAEAAFVAGRIADLVAGGYKIPGEGGEMRAATWGDFAILLRSMKGRAEAYARALSDRGIPVATPGGEGFFESFEVSLTLSLLSVIDNPIQDVPLVAVLKSPVYGFTPDELAAIRLADKNAPLYEALERAAETDAKCRAFLDELNSFRADAPDMPADRMIWRVLNRTDLLAIVGAMPGGEARRENLMKLVDLASRCESGGYKGLFGFVSFMRRMEELGAELAGEGTVPDTDAVKIMSIHKSKGLEFPVVILADTTRQFNASDLKRPVILDAQLGVGLKRVDFDRRIEYPTLPRMAVSLKLKREMLAEELRVLYVAMTRAREKLVVVASYGDAEKALSRLSRDASAPVPPQILEGASCQADFILLPALTRPEAGVLRRGDVAVGEPDGETWDIALISAGRPASDCGPAAKKEQPEKASPPENLVEAARGMLRFRYPHPKAPDLPSKLTATELKGRFSDYEAAEEAQAAVRLPDGPATAIRPAFASSRTGLAASERGTAVHLAMQHIKFECCRDAEGVRGELSRLVETGLLTKEQGEAVDPGQIAAFFSSPLGHRLAASPRSYREFKFSLLVRAGEYFSGGGDDEILFQGVVDCCFEEDGELVIVDFKTDRLSAEELPEKTALYRGQLDAYSKAMERITGMPVKSRYLYFFSLGRAVEA